MILAQEPDGTASSALYTLLPRTISYLSVFLNNQVSYFLQAFSLSVVRRAV
jgi:hypothetical protein